MTFWLRFLNSRINGCNNIQNPIPTNPPFHNKRQFLAKKWQSQLRMRLMVPSRWVWFDGCSSKVRDCSVMFETPRWIKKQPTEPLTNANEYLPISSTLLRRICSITVSRTISPVLSSIIRTIFSARRTCIVKIRITINLKDEPLPACGTRKSNKSSSSWWQ